MDVAQTTDCNLGSLGLDQDLAGEGSELTVCKRFGDNRIFAIHIQQKELTWFQKMFGV